MKEKMYTAHTFTLPFKENRLQSQVPTCTSTLACTSNQFRSSWRLCPNHTLRMRMGPLLQRKGPGRRMPPLQAPNHKLSLLSKLTLAPATSSNLTTASFTASMFIRQDTNTVMFSAYAETFAWTQPAKKILCKARRALSSISLWSRGSTART